jgi:hypothetical protein
MKTYLLRPLVMIGAMLALVFGLALPVPASAEEVPWGVPGSNFTFRGGGFKGGDKDNKDEAGEQLAYWITTPSGAVIDHRHLDDEDDQAHTEKPYLTHARHDGSVILSWRAPADSAIGMYALTIHGQSSQRELVFPFLIKPQSAMTVTQHGITPATGAAGTTFEVRATGFGKGATKSDDGERAAYWINLPDGGVIATEERTTESDYGNIARPLLHTANHDGIMTLYWTAPADAVAGNYSIVLHGLDTQLEVVIPFTLR